MKEDGSNGEKKKTHEETRQWQKHIHLARPVDSGILIHEKEARSIYQPARPCKQPPGTTSVFFHRFTMAYTVGQKYRHSKPRRVTVTKIVLLLILVVGTYVVMTFAPPFWRYYKASAIMDEAGQQASLSRQQNEPWGQIHSRIHAKVKNELIRTLKIPEHDLHLEVDKRDGSIFVKAKWKAVARWPIIGKASVLHFTEEIHFSARH